MTSGELTRPGVGEGTAPDPTVILNPVILARDYLINGLQQVAAGQEHWGAWPESANVSPRPSLLRVGRVLVEGGEDVVYPLVVPLLGEGNILIGNPGLKNHITVEPQKVKLAEVKTEAQRAAAEEARRNQWRLARLQAERQTAIGVVAGLITRAGGTLPGDHLHVTVYDPYDRGRDFAALHIMNNRNDGEHDAHIPRYAEAGPGDLPSLLQELELDIRERYARLGAYRSLRKYAEETGKPPIPWRIVALIGNGEHLCAKDQERLDAIARLGPASGISLILSGFDTHERQYTTHLELNPPQRARASTAPGMEIYLDSPPSPQEMMRAVAHDRPISEVPDSARMTGRNYSRMLAARRGFHEEAKVIMAEHQRTFPFLTPEFLGNHLVRAEERYHALVHLVANNGEPHGTALAEARRALQDVTEDIPFIDQLAAWAALQLVHSADDRRIPMALSTAAGRYVTSNITKLAQILVATAPGGQQWLGVHKEAMEPYIASYLPEETPALIYQLVAEAASPTHWETLAGPSPAVEAICYDVGQFFYGSQEFQPILVKNRELRTALAELRLLGLYGFAEEGTPEGLRDLLARRVGRRIGRITRDQLPPTAHPIYDAYASYVETQEKAHKEQARVLGEIAARPDSDAAA